MRVRAVSSLLCATLVAGFCALLAGADALAETIVVNDAVTVRQSNVARPTRGMHMTQVESKFGAPATRHPAVGSPPITRWDYADFSVFFEHDIVLHSVVPGEHMLGANDHAPAGDDHTATADEHPAAAGDRAPAGDEHPSGGDQTPSGNEQAPTGNERAPTTGNEQTPVGGDRPAATDNHAAGGA
jgi:hypothetical protein